MKRITAIISAAFFLGLPAKTASAEEKKGYDAVSAAVYNLSFDDPDPTHTDYEDPDERNYDSKVLSAAGSFCLGKTAFSLEYKRLFGNSWQEQRNGKGLAKYDVFEMIIGNTVTSEALAAGFGRGSYEEKGVINPYFYPVDYRDELDLNWKRIGLMAFFSEGNIDDRVRLSYNYWSWNKTESWQDKFEKNKFGFLSVLLDLGGKGYLSGEKSFYVFYRLKCESGFGRRKLVYISPSSYSKNYSSSFLSSSARIGIGVGGESGLDLKVGYKVERTKMESDVTIFTPVRNLISDLIFILIVPFIQSTDKDNWEYFYYSYSRGPFLEAAYRF